MSRRRFNWDAAITSWLLGWVIVALTITIGSLTLTAIGWVFDVYIPLFTPLYVAESGVDSSMPTEKLFWRVTIGITVLAGIALGFYEGAKQ